MDSKLREVLERLASSLSKSSAAAREGADKCPPNERGVYLAFADHLAGFATEARAALSAAPTRTVVKRLEWTQESGSPHFWTARTDLGATYGITEYEGMQVPFKLSGNALNESLWFRTRGAAKAAAQSDFETRIRSALVEEPSHD